MAERGPPEKRKPSWDTTWKTGLLLGLGTPLCPAFALEEKSGSSWLPLALQGPGAFQRVRQVGGLNSKPGKAKALSRESWVPRLAVPRLGSPCPPPHYLEEWPKDNFNQAPAPSPSCGPGGVMEPPEHPFSTVHGGQ